MKYRVEGGVAQIGTDMLLDLTKDQAASRAYALEKIGNSYRPKQVVQFKAGEIIGINKPLDALPGSLSSLLVPAGQEKTTRSERKAATAAKAREKKVAAQAEAERIARERAEREAKARQAQA